MSQSLILRGDANSDLELVDKFLANLRKSIVDAWAAGASVAIKRDDHLSRDFRYMGTTFTASVLPSEKGKPPAIESDQLNIDEPTAKLIIDGEEANDSAKYLRLCYMRRHSIHPAKITPDTAHIVGSTDR